MIRNNWTIFFKDWFLFDARSRPSSFEGRPPSFLICSKKTQIWNLLQNTILTFLIVLGSFFPADFLIPSWWLEAKTPQLSLNLFSSTMLTTYRQYRSFNRSVSAKLSMRFLLNIRILFRHSQDPIGSKLTEAKWALNDEELRKDICTSYELLTTWFHSTSQPTAPLYQ